MGGGKDVALATEQDHEYFNQYYACRLGELARANSLHTSFRDFQSALISDIETFYATYGAQLRGPTRACDLVKLLRECRSYEDFRENVVGGRNRFRTQFYVAEFALFAAARDLHTMYTPGGFNMYAMFQWYVAAGN